MALLQAKVAAAERAAEELRAASEELQERTARLEGENARLEEEKAGAVALGEGKGAAEQVETESIREILAKVADPGHNA